MSTTMDCLAHWKGLILSGEPLPEEAWVVAEQVLNRGYPEEKAAALSLILLAPVSQDALLHAFESLRHLATSPDSCCGQLSWFLSEAFLHAAKYPECCGLAHRYSEVVLRDGDFEFARANAALLLGRFAADGDERSMEMLSAYANDRNAHVRTSASAWRNIAHE